MKTKTYTLTSKVWLYPGESANWHFITLEKVRGQEIKKDFGSNAKGFGSLPVEVTIAKTTWKTSIFPDKYSGSYILPLKAKVRKSEEIEAGEVVKFSIVLL
ncbi:MAG: hypothetical protein RL538_730 [Candidatus Parcubacteria bacterium]|jgi:hypothetical protein